MPDLTAVLTEVHRDPPPPPRVAQLIGQRLGLAEAPVHLLELADGVERPAQLETQVDRLRAGIGLRRQVAERGQRLLEPRDRLAMRRALLGLGAGLPRVPDRAVPHLSPVGVVREPVDVLDQALRPQPLDRAGDARVQRAPARLREAAVSDVVGEHVAKGVLEIGEEPRLVEELAGLQRGELPRQVRVTLVRDLLEQDQRDVGAHHRGRLEQALGAVRQPVDAGGQDRLDGMRDLERLDGPRLPVGARLSREHADLAQGPDRLLEEEGVTIRQLDQEPLEGAETRVRAEQGLEELVGRLRGQGLHAKLRADRDVGPAVLVLRPVGDHQQQARGRQARHHLVEERLGLGVDPVQVLAQEQHRPPGALPHEQHPHRIERAPPALGGVQVRPVRIVTRHVEEPEQRGVVARQGRVERHQLLGDLLPDPGMIVPALDPEVLLQEIDHRGIARAAAVRHRARLEHDPLPRVR